MQIASGKIVILHGGGGMLDRVLQKRNQSRCGNGKNCSQHLFKLIVLSFISFVAGKEIYIPYKIIYLKKLYIYGQIKEPSTVRNTGFSYNFGNL